MKIFAHRGARAYAPENTMAAFRLGWEMQADGIELDVQLTRDDQVVICHDHTINRTSSGKGWLRDYTLSELKRLDFGGWFAPKFAGEAIPTLAEFAAWFQTTPMTLNVEIKNGPVIYAGIEEKVVAILGEYRLLERTIVSSFYHPSLVRLRELAPGLKTAALFSVRPLDPCRLARETGAAYLHPSWHYLDAAWTKEAKASGLGINAYTVNSPEEYAFFKALDIDGIFSDYPDIWR